MIYAHIGGHDGPLPEIQLSKFDKLKTMTTKTKFNQLQLWVVCNIYGQPGFLFDVYSDWKEAKTHADSQNSLHQDDNTLYDVIDLYHYTQYLTGNYENVLQAYNEQEAD